MRCISLSLLLRFYEPHPAMLRSMAREDCATKDFLSQPKKVLVTLIRFICSFFSTARRMNQEAPPQLSGACLYSNPPLLLSLRVFLTPPSLRTPPLYFAVQNTGEEGESNPPLIAVRYPAYGARQGRIVIQRIFFPSQRKSLLH